MAKRSKTVRHYARRAVAAGRWAVQGAKGTAVAGAVGAVAEFAATELTQRVEMLQTNWWALPAVMLAGGHFLKRRYPVAGVALCAAAGYQGMMSYRQQAANPKPAEAKGLMSPGAVSQAISAGIQGALNQLPSAAPDAFAPMQSEVSSALML